LVIRSLRLLIFPSFIFFGILELKEFVRGNIRNEYSDLRSGYKPNKNWLQYVNLQINRIDPVKTSPKLFGVAKHPGFLVQAIPGF
jgi:hypothetical protein